MSEDTCEDGMDAQPTAAQLLDAAPAKESAVCQLQHRTDTTNPFGTETFPESPSDPWDAFCWYHGTRNRDTAISILTVGFDPSAQPATGKSYGPGVYFTVSQCSARAYGPYVFTVTLDNVRLLRVTDVPNETNLATSVPDLRQPDTDELGKRLRISAEPYKAVAAWAQSTNRYHGLYLFNVEEGTIATVFGKTIQATQVTFVNARCPQHQG
jgi:hypothetical protein